MLTRWELRHDFERVAHDVYVARGLRLDAVGRAKAAVLWTKGRGVLLGLSASALLGSKWIDADTPAEIAMPTYRRPPPWIISRQARIPCEDRRDIDGFPVTTPERTAFDLARTLPLRSAVPALDALCRATGLTPSAGRAYAAGHAGARGSVRAGTALSMVDPGAESPPESLTRLLIVTNGLPAPTTQIVVRDRSGEFIARLDMGWSAPRVGVEYDGAHHWTDPAQRTKDIDRAAALADAGWHIIRVSANLLHRRPHVLLDRIHSALATRNAPLDT
ncbi:endonuclease domain-containing protein [Nocardia asteroides]|uniref:endonuclease domain-containing protein n=1 Tax=Nocardia asteroides TaxID=1824 RepID=UPI0033EE4741